MSTPQRSVLMTKEMCCSLSILLRPNKSETNLDKTMVQGKTDPSPSSFSGMGRCERCVPCFVKRCYLCSNCLHFEGKRVHKKCKRQICVRDRKSIFPSANPDINKGQKRFLRVVQEIQNGKKDIKKVQPCNEPEKFAQLFMQIISQ